MNSVLLIGYLCDDPKVVHSTTDFNIAVTDEGKTYYFSCRAYGKLAETIDEYIKKGFGKGSKVMIKGKLVQDSDIRIAVDRIDFLSWKPIEDDKEIFDIINSPSKPQPKKKV